MLRNDPERALAVSCHIRGAPRTSQRLMRAEPKSRHIEPKALRQCEEACESG
jgi:hypothetical protein